MRVSTARSRATLATTAPTTRSPETTSIERCATPAGGAPARLPVRSSTSGCASRHCLQLTVVTCLERSLQTTRGRQLHRVQLRVVDDPRVLARRGAERRIESRVRLLSLVLGGVAAEGPRACEQRQDEQDERAGKAQPEAEQAKRMGRVRAPERPAAGGSGVDNRCRSGREAVEQGLPPVDHHPSDPVGARDGYADERT
jgi:hypothetical protein